MDLGLNGRVAVVTGGGSGIGLATATRLNDEGARVVVGDRYPSAAESVAELLVEVDLSTADGCETLIERTAAELGRLDVLVNNVGIFPYRESFLAVSDRDWQALMDVNFMSMVRCSRAAIPHMLERGSGSIVSIASDVARAPDVFFVDYGVSKASVLSVSKALSIEFGPRGIRSNTVSPGPTRTPPWDRPGGFGDSLATEFEMDKEAAIEHFAKVVRKLPLGKLGDPEDVAAVVAFLASDAAKHVTGSDYCVDGGVVAAA